MRLSSLGLLLVLLCASNSAFALFCGNYIIDINDRKDEVYEKCGEPESTQTRTKQVAYVVQDRFRMQSYLQYEDVIVDEWTYNFGPSRFKQYLRFENNVLREIKELQRGHMR